MSSKRVKVGKVDKGRPVPAGGGSGAPEHDVMRWDRASLGAVGTEIRGEAVKFNSALELRAQSHAKSRIRSVRLLHCAA